jgi:hypothetical protein
LVSIFTVELEEDEVSDSRNDARPRGSITVPSAVSSVLLLALLLVTGGRVKAGLPCRILGVVDFKGAMMPGD